MLIATCFLNLMGQRKISGSYKYGGPADFGEKTKFIGADFNPLLSQFIPFNSISKNSPLAFVKRTYWNNNGLRMGFGVNTETNESYFSFEIGYDHRKQLHDSKWYIFKGTELGFNVYNNKTVRASGGGSVWTEGAYFSAHLGVEYTIDKYLSISTEGRAGLYSSVGLRIIPPINFNFHLKL